MPVILPVCRHLDTILEMSESLDGILFAGGNDIDPGYYGEETKE